MMFSGIRHIKIFIKTLLRKIKIPAKIENVDDYIALRESIDENLKRRELKPTEVTKAIKKLYQLWIQKKRYVYSIAGKYSYIAYIRSIQEKYHI